MEDFLMALPGLAVFVLMIVLIVIGYKTAQAFFFVAKEKGYSGRRYFWYPFLLGWVGYLLVVALPDKNARPMRWDGQ